MTISELPITMRGFSNSILYEWNPLQELSDPESITPPTLLIYGDNATAHQAAAELIARLTYQLPNMPIFVIPETPKNVKVEVDKTTEVMQWLSDTRNRGLNPAITNAETPIPLVYLSSVTDLYTETSLARMVRRARFIGVAVVAVSTRLDTNSKMFSNVSAMFTHTIHV